MTTIVLVHPSENCSKYQVFAIYDAPRVHHIFAVQELDRRSQAEYIAHEMMETYEADHFRRVIEVGERIVWTARMSSGNENLEDQIRTLMAAGRKIEAIKLYRSATGAGLAEAKNAVEALELGRPLIEPGERSFERDVITLLEQGKKIAAIKLYRQQTGVGLKEAKDFIEALMVKKQITARPMGCLSAVLLMVFAVFLIYW